MRSRNAITSPPDCTSSVGYGPPTTAPAAEMSDDESCRGVTDMSTPSFKKRQATHTTSAIQRSAVLSRPGSTCPDQAGLQGGTEASAPSEAPVPDEIESFRERLDRLMQRFAQDGWTCVSRLDDLEYVRFLGQGSFGNAKLYRDKAKNADVVLKRIPLRSLSTKEVTAANPSSTRAARLQKRTSTAGRRLDPSVET